MNCFASVLLLSIALAQVFGWRCRSIDVSNPLGELPRTNVVGVAARRSQVLLRVPDKVGVDAVIASAVADERRPAMFADLESQPPGRTLRARDGRLLHLRRRRCWAHLRVDQIARPSQQIARDRPQS